MAATSVSATEPGDRVEATTGVTPTIGAGPPPLRGGGMRVYKASGGRKVVLTVVLLLLLPFFVSLPVMIGWRASAGLVADAAWLSVVAVIFGLCLLFVLVHAIYSYRTRIEVGEAALKLKVPRWRGPTPGLFYRSSEIPYADIAKVETRGEVYRELAVPSLMRAASIVTKAGERIALGYAQEISQDPAFPIGEIAREVALRAGVPIEERSGVRVGSQYLALLRGGPRWSEAAEDGARPAGADAHEEYDRLVGGNHRLMFYLAFVLFGLAGIALVVDLGRAGFLNSGG